jgi:endonuclease/exonuclease/phosphatase family metal-dependent hydrolase
VLSNIEKEKRILMGDFNMTPDDALLKPIKEKMKDVTDTFDTPLFSWPSDNPEKKIDYIFVSRDIEVVSADIPKVIASDHRPHTAKINI